MKRATICVFVLLFAEAAGGADHPSSKPTGTAKLMDGLGHHRHPVSTTNIEAQRFFDQGLTLLYAFNHEEAARSFAHAAELDPKLAMAYWGQAVVKGPNYNLDADEEQWKAAYAALQKALQMADQASEPERDYIHALAKRYGPDPQADRVPLAEAYSQAMRELSQKYPEDLDAATLYAESAMNLRPWKLWSPEHEPAPGTDEIVAVLESVLRKNPEHPGANHYYIHAIEASPYPERGLASANRLASIAPAAGHLLHMPAHIYMRVGDYAAAAASNAQAVAADQAYIQEHKPTGAYPMMYYPHNLHFLSVVHCFQGRFDDALKAATALAEEVGPNIEQMPMLEGFMVVAPMVLVRFHRWDEILSAELPSENRLATQAAWRFARGLAYLGKNDLQRAEQERRELANCIQKIPEDLKLLDWNTAHDILGIAELIFDAKLSLARNDRAKAIQLLRQAVEKEDALNFGEPPDWIMPVRETLGAVLLLGGNAEEAEQVFRAGLDQHPRSGRCLLGLRESLKAQNQNYAAQQIDQRFRAAWKNADSGDPKLSDY